MAWFTVQYRDKNGAKAEAEFEAADKSALFKLLAEKNISAVSVRDGRVGKEKNRRRRAAKGVLTGSYFSLIKGIVAGLALVVVALAAWHFLRTASPTQKYSTRGKKAKSVSTVSKPPQKIKPKHELAEVQKPQKARYWEQPTTNGLTECQILKWKHMHSSPPSYTNNAMRLRPKSEFEIFDTRAENEIAMFMTMEPGTGLVGDPDYGDAFRNEFLKSCETPILISDDDNDYQRQLKKDMIALKLELRDRMRNGEDICAIMRETREEMMRLGTLKQQIEDELHEMLRNAKSKEDVEVSVEAANKLLEDNGVSPIKLSPITKQVLMRRYGINY